VLPYVSIACSFPHANLKNGRIGWRAHHSLSLHPSLPLSLSLSLRILFFPPRSLLLLYILLKDNKHPSLPFSLPPSLPLYLSIFCIRDVSTSLSPSLL